MLLTEHNSRVEKYFSYVGLNLTWMVLRPPLYEEYFVSYKSYLPSDTFTCGRLVFYVRGCHYGSYEKMTVMIVLT